MRTTVDINDKLLQRAKRRATDEGTSLRVVVEEALLSYLDQPKEKRPYHLEWHVDSGELKPGVDLADRNSLFDLMDDLP